MKITLGKVALGKRELVERCNKKTDIIKATG